MDSLTHIALGACIGEAFAGKKLGKKAMLWGALVQSIPDIDFIAGTWLNTSENLLAHRGFTHSVLFAIIIVPLLALLAKKWHRPHNISLKKWILFFSTEMFVHLFLDGFNAYGIGWFEPFSHQRFSFNTIFVADPFFSIWPGIAFLMLLVLKRNNKRRSRWWKLGVVLPTVYLFFCCIDKLNIDAGVNTAFTNENIQPKKYITTPTPFNNLLWYVVAENDSGFYIGYRSLFDKKKAISFQFFPRNEYLLQNVSDHEELQRLKRFSKGFYTAELKTDTLVFNDLRFGQIAGWQNPQAQFVFHYYLQHSDNSLVVQRGRFAGWNRKTFNSLIKRIKGD